VQGHFSVTADRMRIWESREEPADRGRKSSLGRDGLKFPVVPAVVSRMFRFRPLLAIATVLSLLTGLPGPAAAAAAAAAADLLVVCGGSEVFQIDPAATPPAKRWSWRAADHPQLPESLRTAFATTADCKPLDGGRQLLVVSSGGGCALLDLPSGTPRWWARVTNAHSIETLPGGRILVASSVGATGNKLVLFDAAVPEKILAETPLPSAHGIVWDEKRSRVWAIGMDELGCYELGAWDSPTPALVLKSSHRLPDRDGHDLRAVPGGPDLVLSTDAHVWLFDRDQEAFRPHPELHGKAHVKAVEPHPVTGRLAVVQAKAPEWWTDSIGLLQPAHDCRLAGERIYKARWLPARD
jgi:hypothetical protein